MEWLKRHFCNVNAHGFTWIQGDCSSQLSRDSTIHLWKGEAHATMPEGGIDQLLVR